MPMGAVGTSASCMRRCSACRSDFRPSTSARQHAHAAEPLIAIIVPFREQAQQDRKAQLQAFTRHMSEFLRDRRFILIVVQQSDDGRAFNRGALLNVGFVEAQRLAGATPLSSVIFHDVDLLPSAGLLPWYVDPPIAGRPTHIAAPSAWRKYALPGYEEIFFGGVTALHPDDFARANGFPNDYWGWGMEDDQLRLRIEASGGLAQGLLRPPAGAGAFRDLDEVRMLALLESRESLRTNAHLFNRKMFEQSRQTAAGTRLLDAEWRDANGLRGLRYDVQSRAEQALGRDCTLLHLAAHLEASG